MNHINYLPDELKRIIYDFDTFKFDILKLIIIKIPKIKENKIIYILHQDNHEILLRKGRVGRKIITSICSCSCTKL